MIITPFLVIAMIVVFVLLFLFFKTVDKRKWLVLIVSLVLTPFVYFYMFYPFVNIVSNYHHQKYFNSEAWIEKPNLRYEMIDSTISSDTLIGVNKEKAEQLLGTHEWLTWSEEMKAHDQDKWNYGMGIEPGAFNDKIECVEITFTDNKISSLKHFQKDITFEKNEEE